MPTIYGRGLSVPEHHFPASTVAGSRTGGDGPDVTGLSGGSNANLGPAVRQPGFWLSELELARCRVPCARDGRSGQLVQGRWHALQPDECQSWRTQ